MTVAVNILSQVYPRLVKNLAQEDREYLAGALRLQRAEAGTRLIEHGEPSDALFMVAEGDLRITLPSERGEVDLGMRGAGRWVGELGMIEPGEASATVDAATDVTLWMLGHDAFETMRRENPCAAARVMEEVSRDVASRLRACRKVLFREAGEGHIEVVPAQEAPQSVLSALVKEVRDLFGGADEATPAAPPAPDVPDRPSTSLTLDQFIRDHESLSCLSPEDREHLIQACEVRELPDGHAFIREDDSRDAVYFVLEGLVEVSVRKTEGASFAVDRFMVPGETIGLVALVDRGKRSATCRARGKVRLGVLTLEGANLLMNTRARVSCAFQYTLASQLARDARSLNESLLHAAAHPDAK